MDHEPTPDDLARRKARIEAFREVFTAETRKKFGPEMTVEFHPDALVELFEDGILDAPEEAWAQFLAEMGGGEFEKVAVDDDDDAQREAQKRVRDIRTGKRETI